MKEKKETHMGLGVQVLHPEEPLSQFLAMTSSGFCLLPLPKLVSSWSIFRSHTNKIMVS